MNDTFVKISKSNRNTGMSLIYSPASSVRAQQDLIINTLLIRITSKQVIWNQLVNKLRIFSASVRCCSCKVEAGKLIMKPRLEQQNLVLVQEWLNRSIFVCVLDHDLVTKVSLRFHSHDQKWQKRRYTCSSRRLALRWKLLRWRKAWNREQSRTNKHQTPCLSLEVVDRH